MIKVAEQIATLLHVLDKVQEEVEPSTEALLIHQGVLAVVDHLITEHYAKFGENLGEEPMKLGDFVSE